MAYIIADIGSNFSTLEDAYHSIAAAKSSGADMVKFQCFSEHDLYGDGETKRKIEPWLSLLADFCERLNIDFGCTAFSPEGVSIVNPFVKSHKVASSCVTHLPLLRAISAANKWIIMSVGACTVEEITAALDVFHGNIVTLLYCAASYPSRFFNPDAIQRLRNLFRLPVGYSDHTTDIWGAPAVAARLGACVIEKHMTAFPDLASPDRPHSLTPIEFRQMVDATRCPRIEIGPTPEELDFVKYHKVRLTDRGYYRERK
jgi:N,N'-diacetyllegionaminate synthase